MKYNLLYKRYKVDLWGLLATRRRVSSLQVLGHLLHQFRRKFFFVLRSLNLTPPRVQRKRKKRLSFFGRLLMRKQRFRLFYSGLRERQLRRLVVSSARNQKPVEALVGLVESRLQTVLLRALLTTPGALRQFVSHRGGSRILVNGQPTAGSRILAPGDLVELNSVSAPLALATSPLPEMDWLYLLDTVEIPPVVLFPPEHLEINYVDLSLCLVTRPNSSTLALPFGHSTTEIFEFYRYIGLILWIFCPVPS